MFRVTLDIVAREPLAITNGSAEGMAHRSLPYIPGNMLLGAYAGLWVRYCKKKAVPDDDPDFRSLFLDGSLSWGHAYPCVGALACVPLPASYRRLKNHAGLPTEGNDADSPAPFVVNLQALDQEEGAWKNLWAAHTGSAPEEAPKLKKIGASFMEPESRCVPGMLEQWTMHVALDPENRRAAQSQLFGYDSIGAGTRFQSLVYCRNKHAAERLCALAALRSELKVGHARSAGYGSIEVHAAPPEELPCEQQKLSASCSLFLLSDYIPRHSWQQPLQGLLDELSPFLGKLDMENVQKSFCSHAGIAGFNNLWKLPRTTRTALAKGSVIEISLTQKECAVSLPPFLGSSTTEGHGRILLNPSFLKEDAVKSFSRKKPEPRPCPPRPCPPQEDRVLSLLRRQALRRQIHELALEHCDSLPIQRFIASAARSPITQSQRGNIRRMATELAPQGWRQTFENMGATPEKKWKNAVACNPHTTQGGNNDIHAIMCGFLDADYPMACAVTQSLALPGGDVDAREQTFFAQQFHREFILMLLQSWERAYRQEGGN